MIADRIIEQGTLTTGSGRTAVSIVFPLHPGGAARATLGSRVEQ